jgi:hypothetical protein
MTENAAHSPRGRLRSAWPWLVLALTVVPAVWHVVDYPDDVDGEVPGVERPTFNRFPPAAYRLAEPGDTIDRVAIYMGGVFVVLSAIGLLRSGGQVGLWPASLALALASLWHAATPGPTVDGWHGLGWRAIADPSAPGIARLSLAVAAIGLGGIVAGNVFLCAGRFRSRCRLPSPALRAPSPAGRGECNDSLSPRERVGVRVPQQNETALYVYRSRLAHLWRHAADLKVRNLLIAASLLVAARQVELPGVEPAGYWPRWAFVWGLLASALACLRIVFAQGRPRPRIRLAFSVGGVAAWCGIVVLAVNLSWFHRPLARLRTVEPGKIYISAMPTYRGLEVAHARHHFKTIINIFPEDTAQRSVLLPEEERFVREHGIRYVQALASDNDSDQFLDETLALAQDPEAWPILVHCHGCMDRSPAWMGIYRFVVQGRPLDAILKEIEAHRGDRPKAMITLLFARVLKDRAPERFRDDPTARRLESYAHGQRHYPRASRPETITRAGDGPGRP